ncbi:MAG: acylphosphatase [Candidatus Micrarchaeota archaeon]|nr:acylphosphatase [Candidatus Micrarchaeota archaeon]
MQRIVFVASGRVQGVGFRSFACRIANSLQLVGYAKNLQDGTVELLVEGDEKKISQFAKTIQNAKLPAGIYVEQLTKVYSERISKLVYPDFSAL